MDKQTQELAAVSKHTRGVMAKKSAGSSMQRPDGAALLKEMEDVEQKEACQGVRSAKKQRGAQGIAAPAPSDETEDGFKLAMGRHTFRPSRSQAGPQSPQRKYGDVNKCMMMNSPGKPSKASPRDHKVDYSVLMGDAQDEQEGSDNGRTLFPSSGDGQLKTEGLDEEEQHYLDTYFKKGGG